MGMIFSKFKSYKYNTILDLTNYLNSYSNNPNISDGYKSMIKSDVINLLFKISPTDINPKIKDGFMNQTLYNGLPPYIQNTIDQILEFKKNNKPGFIYNSKTYKTNKKNTRNTLIQQYDDSINTQPDDSINTQQNNTNTQPDDTNTQPDDTNTQQDILNDVTILIDEIKNTIKLYKEYSDKTFNQKDKDQHIENSRKYNETLKKLKILYKKIRSIYFKPLKLLYNKNTENKQIKELYAVVFIITQYLYNKEYEYLYRYFNKIIEYNEIINRLNPIIAYYKDELQNSYEKNNVTKNVNMGYKLRGYEKQLEDIYVELYMYEYQHISVETDINYNDVKKNEEYIKQILDYLKKQNYDDLYNYIIPEENRKPQPEEEEPEGKEPERKEPEISNDVIEKINNDENYNLEEVDGGGKRKHRTQKKRKTQKGKHRTQKKRKTKRAIHKRKQKTIRNIK